jgi:peptidoglycan/LPS O-acetylase OafA/YrhL
VAATVGLAVLMTTHRGLSAFFFRGGFTLVAALSALVIYQVVHAPSLVSTVVLRARPLVLTGKISYGIYLWHYVVLRALFPEHGLPGPGLASLPRTALGLLLTVLLAVTSFLVVEQPFLRLKARFSALRSSSDRSPLATTA